MWNEGVALPKYTKLSHTTLHICAMTPIDWGDGVGAQADPFSFKNLDETTHSRPFRGHCSG
jgi:hypothetical protein